MRRMFWGMFVVASLGATACAQNGQSLADVARGIREKQQEQKAAGIEPRVITLDDLPASNSAGIPPEDPSNPMTQVSGVQRSFRSYQRSGYQNGGWQRPFGQPGWQQASYGQGGCSCPRGDQWRGQIRAQQYRIAAMQSRMDRANGAMRPYGSTAQWSGPLNRYQGVQVQRIESMQESLDWQRPGLADLQDEARQAGLHTTGYEP